MRRSFADLGVPLDTLEAAFVNGQFYSRLRPLIRGDKPATRLPPAPMLKVLTRLHPEMRRRNRTAGRVLAAEPWVEVIRAWHGGGKASIEAANLKLQRIDLVELSDADVLDHVGSCLAHCRANWEHHFWLHGYDLGPLGRYLYEAEQWGLAPSDLLGLLEGASPSTSAPNEQLVRIRAAVEASGQQPTGLEELRSISPEIAAMVEEHLRRRGAVLFSRYDIDGVTLAERPDLVFASIMNAGTRDTSAEVAARTAALRAKVPREQVVRFDTLLGQARDAMDLRDDNGPTTAEWPLGLLRLSLLELGRRLVSRGVIDRPELVFELEPEELAPELFDAVPSQATLEARAERRQAMKKVEAPSVLGAHEPAPPLEVLPANLATLVGMVQTVMQQLGMDGAAKAGGLYGTGIGEGTTRGRARLATSPEAALDVLEPGDILLVAGTTPAYNLVLSLAGGIVTAEGGPMSHAAVIARELGIPAVIGVKGALTDIPDGTWVELDPVAGEVRLLANQPA
jgi:pyruvate,water dikinase